MVNDPSLFGSFLMGVLLPLLISLILAREAAPWLKSLVVFLLCLVFTAVSMWLADKIVPPPAGLSTNDTLKLWVENFGILVMTAWGTYEHFWKPTTIAPALNTAGLKVGRARPPTP